MNNDLQVLVGCQHINDRSSEQVLEMCQLLDIDTYFGLSVTAELKAVINGSRPHVRYFSQAMEWLRASSAISSTMRARYTIRVNHHGRYLIDAPIVDHRSHVANGVITVSAESIVAPLAARAIVGRTALAECSIASAPNQSLHILDCAGSVVLTKRCQENRWMFVW